MGGVATGGGGAETRANMTSFSNASYVSLPRPLRTAKKQHGRQIKRIKTRSVRSHLTTRSAPKIKDSFAKGAIVGLVVGVAVGFVVGFDEGLREGRKDGLVEGLAVGFEDGLDEGRNDGTDVGFDVEGVAVGFADGFVDGL